MDTETRRSILIEARTWVDTPFHHKGRLKGVGVDCGGFIYCVYNQFMKLKPFPDYYAEDWSLHQGEEIYLNFVSEYVHEVKRPAMAGLALFQFGRCFGHGAICTERRTFLHAHGRTKAGCVQESSKEFFRLNDGSPRPVKYFDFK